MAGLVLGNTESMDWQFWQALQKTGTLHLVAASGMNVAIVSKAIINFLVYIISRRKTYFVSLVFILIYCLLAGGSPAVVRAGLMAGLSLMALVWGREADAGWLLLLTLGIMLLVDPFLLFDISFQLSATAMAGMIWIKPLLTKILGWEVKDGKCVNEVGRKKEDSGKSKNQKISHQKSKISHFTILTSNLLDTISAQIATFPVIYFTFGQFQPLAFLPNIMVIPLVPYLMMFGFVILVYGLIWLPLAYPPAWLVWPGLTCFIKIIEWWGKVL